VLLGDDVGVLVLWIFFVFEGLILIDFPIDVKTHLQFCVSLIIGRDWFRSAQLAILNLPTFGSRPWSRVFPEGAPFDCGVGC
jgi:hypothetical protein